MMFATCAVAAIDQMRQAATGKAFGFAFVDMTNAAQAGRAVAQLNGTQVYGRAIDVHHASRAP